MKLGQMEIVMLVVAMVLRQSSTIPVRHSRSAPNCNVAQRPAQNCSRIAVDHPTLAQRLFWSSVRLKNFTLPVGVHHETRSTSWKKHSAVQNGNTPSYTTCTSKGEPFPTTTQISSDSRLLCQWTYECDYDAGRMPTFLHQAKCNSTQFWIGTKLYQCKPIPTSIKVLQLSGCNADSDTEEWTMADYVISTGCVPFLVQ